MFEMNINANRWRPSGTIESKRDDLKGEMTSSSLVTIETEG